MHSSWETFVPALVSPAGWDSALAFLAASAWKSTVILLAAFGVVLLLRRASASLRHQVWLAAVACLLLLPLASLAVPNWNMTLPAGSDLAWLVLTRPLHGPGTIDSNQPVPREFSGMPIQDVRGAIVRASSAGPVAALLIALWATGFCFVAARLCIGVSRVRGLARGGHGLKAGDWSQTLSQLAARLSLRRPVVLLRSERVSIPMTAGFLRPVILLPNDAVDWPVERRWIVLAHELLHVQRADYFLWMLTRVVCALYWFHPLVWLAAARLRKEAEQACDNGVLRLGAGAPAYAEHLVSLARGWSLTRTARSAAMAMAHSSHLENRIRALLDPTHNRREISRRGRLCVAAAAVVILVSLAAVRATPQADAAALRGTVSDISGARVPRALVTLQRQDLPSKAIVVTDEAGEFGFGSLPTGDYSLEIRAPGFPVNQRTVHLARDVQESLDITLEMGQILESIRIVGKSSGLVEKPRPSGPPRRIRVGGNVQRSKLITQIQPAYPEELKREGIQGMVVLDAVVLTDGSLGNLRAANNLVKVDERLVNAAIEAIRFWRYEPTLLNGVPVEVVTTITVDFRLEP
jgi:TonB family protein